MINSKKTTKKNLVCDISKCQCVTQKTTHNDTLIGILLLYFTNYPIVIKLAINWVEKRNDHLNLQNVRQCVKSFKIKCVNLESSMVWELAQYILCHPIPSSLKCVIQNLG